MKQLNGTGTKLTYLPQDYYSKRLGGSEVRWELKLDPRYLT